MAEQGPATLAGSGAVATDSGGEVALTIKLTRPVGWRLWIDDGPPRVVVELTDIDWSDTPELKTSSIHALELHETAPGVVEMHAVLREPLSILSAEMVTGDNGAAQLNVRLKATTADVFHTELEAEDGKAAQVEVRPVIAIDPGHGGRDPGAEAGRIREADLMLEFAHRLRDVLLASGQFDVVLTRTEDMFLSLDARLTRARDAGGHVLLSLHADALTDENAASGIVLYRLAPGAHASANLRLQERHGPDDMLSGINLAGAEEDVTLTLLDLARQQTVPRTRALSTALLTAFEGVDMVVNTRPERTGHFAVLKGADIPSLLVELGFLSTEADLERLTSADWQTAAAEAIRDGLILWWDEDKLR